MTGFLNESMIASPSAEEVRASISAATSCRGSDCAEWREVVLDAGGESRLRLGTRFMIERCQGQPCGLAPDNNSRVVRTESDEFIGERAAVALSEGGHYAQA